MDSSDATPSRAFETPNKCFVSVVLALEILESGVVVVGGCAVFFLLFIFLLSFGAHVTGRFASVTNTVTLRRDAPEGCGTGGVGRGGGVEWRLSYHSAGGGGHHYARGRNGSPWGWQVR